MKSVKFTNTMLMIQLANRMPEVVQLQDFEKLSSLQILNESEIRSIYWDLFMSYTVHYQDTIPLVIFLSWNLLRAEILFLGESVEFVATLLKGRITLVSLSNSKLVLSQILHSVDLFLQLLVPILLEEEEEASVYDLLALSHQTESLELIATQVQLMLLSKLKKYLSEESFADLMENLMIDTENRQRRQIYEEVLSQSQNYLGRVQFKHLAVIRIDENGYKPHQLLLPDYDNIQLEEVEEIWQYIEKWALSSHRGTPDQIDLSLTKNMGVIDLFKYHVQMEIYASAPSIQEFQDYVDDDEFTQIFIKFLMGQRAAEKQYQFGSRVWIEILENAWQASIYASNAIKESMLNENKRILS